MSVTNDDAEKLVVYCSHDSVFADDILQRFSKETGITVIPRYDTEASKSLGLTERILRQGEQTDCDVYWSNEMFSMTALQQANLLSPYKGPGWQRIPEKYKDPDGLWSGFAARLRVVIFNKELTAEEKLNAVEFDSTDLSKVALALPLYGTTLTHFAALWLEWGPEKLKEKYQSWKTAGIQIVAGNGPSRNLVANGNCESGWTDTDDYFGAVDNQKPVDMIPARLPSGHTICIPNTVGLIKHSDNKQAAQKFIDFLLSEKVEIALANSSSRQIPLGTVKPPLPPEVQKLIPFAQEGAELKNLVSVREELIHWLKQEEKLQ